MDQYSQYLLVEWVVDKKFSVVRRTQLVSAADRKKKDEELIGTSPIITFSKSKAYNALIIQCGDKENMKYEQAFLVQQQKQSKGSNNVDDEHVKSNTQEDIQSVLTVLGNMDSEYDTHESELKIHSLESALELEKTRTEKYKNKYNNLKRKYDDLVLKNDDILMATISEGIVLPKHQLDTILTLSDGPEKLARNLMRALFTHDEMVGHSLFGIKCNANKTLLPRPSIEAKRRDAIILFVLERYGATGTELLMKKNPVRLSVHRSMGDLLRTLKTG